MRPTRVPVTFLIEIDLLLLSDKQAEDECTSRASVYRKAIIDYLKSHGKDIQSIRNKTSS